MAPVKLPPGEPVTPTEAAMREQLLKKQRELIELQKKKIELELLQAKANLEQQQRQLDKQAGNLKAELVSNKMIRNLYFFYHTFESSQYFNCYSNRLQPPHM